MDRARRTQQSYDLIAGRFLERNEQRGVLRAWMLRFKALLPAGPVVDLGAGPCFDSAELRDLGLQVISLDRSRPMLQVARERFPGPRVQADMRQLPLRSRTVAGVWACASLLHLERQDLLPALAGVRDALCDSGVLFVSFKQGHGEGWERSRYGVDAPRWFTYWSEEDLDGALRAAGFELCESATRQGFHEPWIIRLARAAGPA
jgi:SAM-dependent methyltransferase